MPPEQWERVKEAFDAIVDLDAAGRATALSELRLQDPELHAAVEELVANHDRAGDFLTEPMALELVPTLTVGEIIAGRYEIVRFIGRGGMGEVYEAQDNQLGERVALKTIGPDIAWTTVTSRALSARSNWRGTSPTSTCAASMT